LLVARGHASIAAMVARLIAAWPLERYQVWLSFADGTEGAVDLEDRLPVRGRDPLHDVTVFRKLAIDRARNSLSGPNGVGVDATALYRELQRRRRPGAW
jgi:hypothetical protein